MCANSVQHNNGSERTIIHRRDYRPPVSRWYKGRASTIHHGPVTHIRIGKLILYFVRLMSFCLCSIMTLTENSLAPCVTFPHIEVQANHYCDVVMGTMASKITSLMIVYSTVYSGTDQRKHQSSASLAFVGGIHRWPVNSLHKWPVTWKMIPFDDVIMMAVVL